MTLEMLKAMLKGLEENKDLSDADLAAKAQKMLDEQAQERKAELDKAVADATGELNKQLEAEKGKAAGILEAKKLAQEKAAASDTALEEFKRTKMDDKDRKEADFSAMEKKVSDMEKLVVDANKKNEELESGMKLADRTHKLDVIASGFTFTEGLPEGAGRTHFIEAAFKNVDLSDDTAVEAAKILFKASHKGVLVAKAPDGSGHKTGVKVPGGGEDGSGGESEDAKRASEQTPEERKKHLASIK